MYSKYNSKKSSSEGHFYRLFLCKANWTSPFLHGGVSLSVCFILCLLWLVHHFRPLISFLPYVFFDLRLSCLLTSFLTCHHFCLLMSLVLCLSSYYVFFILIILLIFYVVFFSLTSFFNLVTSFRPITSFGYDMHWWIQQGIVFIVPFIWKCEISLARPDLTLQQVWFHTRLFAFL